jgi:hypothetical protein
MDEARRSRLARSLLAELMDGCVMRTPPVLMLSTVRAEDVARRLGPVLGGGGALDDVRAVFRERGLRTYGVLPAAGGELWALWDDDLDVPMADREAGYARDMRGLLGEELRAWPELVITEEGVRGAGEGSLEHALLRTLATQTSTEETGLMSIENTMERIAKALEAIASAAATLAEPPAGAAAPENRADTAAKETKVKDKPTGGKKKATKDQVVARLRDLIDRDGRDAAFEVLKTQGGGADSASALKEEHYGAVMEELEKRLGAAKADPTA